MLKHWIQVAVPLEGSDKQTAVEATDAETFAAPASSTNSATPFAAADLYAPPDDLQSVPAAAAVRDKVLMALLMLDRKDRMYCMALCAAIEAAVVIHQHAQAGSC